MSLAQRIALMCVSCGQLAMLIWIGFAFFEEPWLRYPNLPLKVEHRVYRPGDVVPVQVERCNISSEARAYLITLYLVSVDRPKTVPISSAGVTLVPAEKGCTTYTNKSSAIPKVIDPGQYFIRGQAYVEGRIRSVWIDWYTEPFMVGK